MKQNRTVIAAALIAALAAWPAPLFAGGKKDAGGAGQRQQAAPEKDTSGAGQKQQVSPDLLAEMQARAEALMEKGYKDEQLNRAMHDTAYSIADKAGAETLYEAWKQQPVRQERLLAREQAQKAAAERAAAQAAAKAAEAERQAAADKKAAGERAAAIAAANAKGVTAADFEYDATRDGRGVVIKKYKGLATIVNIPAVIEGLPVTEIGGIDTGRSDDYSGGTVYDGAFQDNTEITSVTVPDSVTSVLEGSSGTVYVGGGGKGDDRYEMKTWGAFAGCTSLKSVTLPRNLKIIPYGMFGDCSSLETITLPAGLERIGEMAFANTALKSIALPGRIAGIGNRAFSGTGLSSVVLPKNLQSLGG
ncbi:MAG: leucine-rich repeat domain-containing protein [Treponema sp.]|jgi:hypothetical protein|nr:leucine-rich repeat domain-containing protein [Treponema sp.]